MIARVRLVIDVPFDHAADGKDPDENGHVEDRIDAAKTAETTIMSNLKKLVSQSGIVLDDLSLIEEVRD